MRGRRGAAMALAAAVVPAASVQAARPLVTDDARLLEAKACQFESWVKRNRDSTEYWAVPACNLTGNLELSFGAARTREGSSALSDVVLQGKSVLRALETGGWGTAFVLGTVRHPRSDVANGWPGDTYLTVPLSMSTFADRWVMHFNVGAVYRRDAKRTVGTWGFAHEIELRQDLHLLPEVYRSEPGKPFYQVGMRYTLMKDRIQLDATYGNRFGSENQHWFSIGVHLQTPPLLP